MPVYVQGWADIGRRHSLCFALHVYGMFMSSSYSMVGKCLRRFKSLLHTLGQKPGD